MKTEYKTSCIRKIQYIKENENRIYKKFFVDITEEQLQNVDELIHVGNLSSVDDANLDIVRKLDELIFKKRYTLLQDWMKSHLNFIIRHFVKASATEDATQCACIGGCLGALFGFVCSLLVIPLHDIGINIMIAACITAAVLGLVCYLGWAVKELCKVLGKVNRISIEMKNIRNMIVKYGTSSAIAIHTDEISQDEISHILKKFCVDKSLREKFLQCYSKMEAQMLKDVQLHFRDIRNVMEHQEANQYDLDLSPIKSSLPVYMRHIIDEYQSKLQDEGKTNVEIIAQCLQR